MKKKFWASIALCLALALPLGLTACGGKDDGATDGYTYETAYATATDLGYAGTLEEFIELISGKDGKDGKDGVNGINGKDGKDGVNGTNGKNGKDGVNGINGKNGKDGVGIKSIYVNSNGQLVIVGTNGAILYQANIPACNHSYVMTALVEPTCTSAGYKEHTCKKCDNVYYDFTEAKGHKCKQRIDISHPENCTQTGHCISFCEVCHTAFAAEFYGEHAYENGFCTLCGEVEPSAGLTFNFNTDGVSYSVSGRNYEGTEVIIPSRYSGLPVTKINDAAFLQRKGLEKVVMPDSITEIGRSAFATCTSLTDIKFSKNLKEIGAFAFRLCQGLTEVTLNSVVEMQMYAFANCRNLKKITLNDGLKTIKFNVFYACTALEEIKVPDTVEVIEHSAFNGCENLKSIIIPKSVKEIGDTAFSGCNALESIYFGGTEAQWTALNTPYEIYNLENATVYFYSGTEPTDLGVYWHYVDGKPQIWG